MPNFLWYVILGFTSLGIIIYTMKRTCWKKNIIIYFIAMGLAFFLELFVLFIGDAYAYYPQLLSDQWYDNTVGSSLSQALFIPSVIMAITALKPKRKIVLLIIAMIYAIEEVFIELGLYEHHWWHSYITSIILLLAIYVIGKWRDNIDFRSSWLRGITIFMASTTILQGVTVFLQIILVAYHYAPGWYSSPARDSIFFNTIYWIISCFMITFILTRYRPYWSLALIGISQYIFGLTLVRMNILQMNGFWHPLLFTLIIMLVVKGIEKIDKYLFSPAKTVL